MSKTSPDSRPIFEGEGKRLEDILEEFESAWSSGGTPNLDNYLSAADVEPRTLLMELVQADLECRLKAGEAVRVESYLAKYSELATDRHAALRLIQAEYDLRRRREPELLPDEYLERFPQYRADLPQRLRGPHGSIPQSPRPAGAKFVGRFELLEQVGQGAFGTVYRASDTELDRIVAMKLPRSDRSFAAADAEKFQREARNAAQLSHPSIVPIYEVGHDAAVPYIVSAYIEGLTLADALVRQHLDYKQIASVLAQVADGLDHAHRHGVVHRDLKPSNIMLGRIQGVGNRESGIVSPDSRLRIPDSLLPATQAFVMDFGLARRDDGEIRMTVEGMVFGTPAYMSPEQARGDNNHVDGRSDMHALGVILYELLTGEVPFRGAARMVLQQIIDEEPRPPRRLDDKIPRDLETIALKCMAKEQGRRYATTGELAADLRRYLDGVPILARPVGSVERAWRWAKRKPLVAGLSAISIILLLTVAIGGSVAAFVINVKKTEAERSAESARLHLELSLDTLLKEVNEIQEQMQDQPALYDLRKRLLLEAESGLRRLAALTGEAEADNGMRIAHERLGDIFLQLRRPQEAREQYDRVLAIVERQQKSSDGSPLLPSFPAIAAAKVGEAYLQMGDLSSATTFCTQAVEKAEELYRDNAESVRFSRDLAQCRLRLGRVELQRSHFQAAVENFERAVQMSSRYVEAEPGNVDAKEDLSLEYEFLGEAQMRLGQSAPAREAYDQAMRLRQVVAQLRHGSTRARRNLSVSCEKLGDIALRANDLPAAEHAYRQASEQREQLAALAPKNSLAQVDLSVAYGKLGELFERKRDLSKARELYEKALPPLDGFATEFPDDIGLKRDRAIAYLKLALINRRQHADARAKDFREKALHQFEEIIDKSPDNILAAIDLSNTLGLLGKVEMDLKDFTAAIRHFERGSFIMEQLQSAGKLHDQPAWQKLHQNHDRDTRVCFRQIALSLWPRVVYEALTAHFTRKRAS
jgi:serine/threonine protein kinase/tetratricopeptide (TPR) repeat protein